MKNKKIKLIEFKEVKLEIKQLNSIKGGTSFGDVTLKKG
ncbi:MAG: natural product precursor [Crocinitomix sp.]|jgi:natural product precursor